MTLSTTQMLLEGMKVKVKLLHCPTMLSVLKCFTSLGMLSTTGTTFYTSYTRLITLHDKYYYYY